VGSVGSVAFAGSFAGSKDDMVGGLVTG
jgi:hypothetical protein